jgi:hypothetical protein
MGNKKSTQKQFVIIGIVALLICVGLSGCNQISNVFLTDEDKLVGTWNSDGIWLDVPTVIVFSSNGTFKIDLGIPNSPIDFSLTEGKWNMNDGVLMMEIVDLIPPSNYTYKFSEDSGTLEITDIGSSDSYILRKQ